MRGRGRTASRAAVARVRAGQCGRWQAGAAPCDGGGGGGGFGEGDNACRYGASGDAECEGESGRRRRARIGERARRVVIGP